MFDRKNVMCTKASAIALLTVLASCASAQTLVLTQSNDRMTVTPLNSASCNDMMGHHTDNSYWRSYTLASHGITTDILVTGIRVGVETSVPGSGRPDQPVSVRLHNDPTPAGGLSPISTLQLLHTENFNMPVLTGVVQVIPITSQLIVPAASTLVVEFFTPNGQVLMHEFFIGSNGAGETGSSFISATDCLIPEPVTPATIGFAGMMIILDVEYEEVVPPTCTLMTAGGTLSGNISMTANATSATSPTVDLTFEYSTDGGATFALCARSLISPVVNPALARPTGPTTFIWDSVGDGVGLTGAVAVTLRATVEDGVSPIPGRCTAMIMVSNMSMTTPCAGICGDCNGDTMGPNILDALVAARIAAGVLMPTTAQRGCCDVNSSGLVEVLDALGMARVGAGLAATINCP